MRLSNGVLVPIVVAVVAVAILLVDQIVPQPSPATPADLEPRMPVSGVATCAVGDGRDGTELLTFAMHPTPDADEPTLLRHRRIEDGESTREAEVTVAPGGAVALPGGGGEAAALTVRWYDQAAVLARSWELQDADLPPGLVQGPCPTASGVHWVIPGLRTEGGAEARIRLANPHDTDATVAIRFLTPEEPIAPTILQNVTVPARDTVEVVANEHVPERLDLGAEVQVASGRVVVEGYQLMRSAIGGIDGASLLAAAEQPAETWTVPWMRAGEARASWLWIYNPAERPAAVELTLHTDDGGVVPQGLGEVTVSPGQLRRVDLTGTFPDDVELAAVTLRSPAVGIYASGAVELAPANVANTGLAVQLGAPEMDDRWVVPGGPVRAGRTERLQLVNPGSEPATVDVVLWDGSRVVRPAELTGLLVPPGARRGAELAEHLPEEAAVWGAVVTATEGTLVVGHVGFGGEGPLRLVAGRAMAVGPIADPVAPVVLRHQPGLAQRLGTARGVQPRSRIPEPEVDPTPLVPLPTPEVSPAVPGATPPDPAPTDPAPTDPAPTDPAPTPPGEP